MGPYEVFELIGSGGQGEVYRARDTRLERNVAIKVLPAHLSMRPELRERFEREARVIAALNHPNICTIFDVGSQDGVDYIVMEYLEGQTLAARLERGPLPLPEALKIAGEMIDALDKAHRKGVTHRDVKTGNIMLTGTGSKLLDFGLAKLAPKRSLSTEQPLSEQPTARGDTVLTAEGTILGTLQYMSPEQLEGQEADARSDIFAFGAVLYEMVTGERAFKGKSKASLIASIMEHDPQPMSELQPVAPPALDRIVAMCMAKDPADRWQTAHNVAKELKWMVEGSAAKRVAEPAGASPKLRQRLAWGLIAVLAITTLAFAGMWGYLYFSTTDQVAVRLSVHLPQGVRVSEQISPAISPNGRYLVLVLQQENRSVLHLQPLDSLGGQVLPGTEGAVGPFWSPDSRFIAFFAEGKLKKFP
jgi:serine/threonine protein kinase